MLLTIVHLQNLKNLKKFKKLIAGSGQDDVLEQSLSLLVLILGSVPRMMVKFNPGLSEILSMVFLLRACNSSSQSTVEPLL